jgi:hypothetical protein
MARALLDAGVRVDGVDATLNARTKEGLTALDLARKYNHAHLLASLGRR